ncbi:MAG TPA: hypothetical protein VK923_13910 [Euzebyales bacterium]|nr:hypothetical protein [Euzebyales bacterium]
MTSVRGASATVSVERHSPGGRTATPGYVVRTTVYVVGPQDALATAWSVFRDSGVSGTPMAPSTLLGVARLGYEGQLVEVDAIVLLVAGTSRGIMGLPSAISHGKMLLALLNGPERGAAQPPTS